MQCVLCINSPHLTHSTLALLVVSCALLNLQPLLCHFTLSLAYLLKRNLLQAPLPLVPVPSSRVFLFHSNFDRLSHTQQEMEVSPPFAFSHPTLSCMSVQVVRAL